MEQDEAAHVPVHSDPCNPENIHSLKVKVCMTSSDMMMEQNQPADSEEVTFTVTLDTFAACVHQSFNKDSS